MTCSRRPGPWASRRSKSPASRSATPRRSWPNPRSEHDRQAGHRTGRLSRRRGVASWRGPADLAPRRVRTQAGALPGEQRTAVPEERGEHQVRGAAHQGPEGREPRSRAGLDERRAGEKPRGMVLLRALLLDDGRLGWSGLRPHEDALDRTGEARLHPAATTGGMSSSLKLVPRQIIEIVIN